MEDRGDRIDWVVGYLEMVRVVLLNTPYTKHAVQGELGFHGARGLDLGLLPGGIEILQPGRQVTGWEVGRGREGELDLAPVDDPHVQHPLHFSFPVPPRTPVWEQLLGAPEVPGAVKEVIVS